MRNVAHIDTNEIIEANPSNTNGNAINYNIKQSILMDYKKGVKKGKITIVASDYYYIDGVRAINWANGDILKVGQIIRVLNKEGNAYLKDSSDKDVLFRIVDRKVRYEGQIFIDLELQEIVRI